MFFQTTIGIPTHFNCRCTLVVVDEAGPPTELDEARMKFEAEIMLSVFNDDNGIIIP